MGVKNISNKKICICSCSFANDLICYECTDMNLLANNDISNLIILIEYDETDHVEPRILSPIPINIMSALRNQIQEFIDEFDNI